MAYTDVRGSLNAAKALVNDLDIVLISPDNRVIKPLVLEPSHPEAIAHEGEDHINNIEQIVYFPSADDLNRGGIWRVLVKGYDVVYGPVEFAIVSNQGFYEPPFRPDYSKDISKLSHFNRYVK